jgi:hypothetical protein
METSKLFLFYIIIIFIIYTMKPSLFKLTDLPDDTRRQKTLFLIFFMMIIAVFIFYIKVFFEYVN